MRHESRNRMFPVGLYGTLLVGLIGVTVPELVAPVERAARTLVSLPLRAYTILLDERAAAAAPAVPPWSAEVTAAQARSALRGARGPAGLHPRPVRVLARNHYRDRVDELVLDVPAAEVAECAPLVTCGPALVGFLDRSPRSDGYARVRLLSYRGRPVRPDDPLRVGPPFLAAAVPAEVACREPDAVGVLRCLVEPSAAAHQWPLRCTTLDDNYLASRLRRSGELVTTAAQLDDPLLPAGLHIGQLMIWGYPNLDIPVGLFVRPVHDPRGISAVVVWQPAEAPAALPALDAARLRQVRFSTYPAPRPGGERWLVTVGARAELPDGAALVDRGRLLGLLQQPWSGQSLVTPFAASARTWSLVLCAADGPARDVVARVAGWTPEGEVRLEVEAPADLAAGELFTGVNGPHCPAGFHIGRVRPAPGGLLLAMPRAPVVEPQVYLGPVLEEDSR